MKKKEDKKQKKGLFRVTKVKVATALTALSLLAAGTGAYHFGFFGSEDDNLNKGTVGTGVGIGSLIDGSEELDSTEPSVDEEPELEVSDEEEAEEKKEEEEELDPEDDDYYFDEEDEFDIDSEEEVKVGNTKPVIVDDFADLVIPNINAYKGQGCSIVDALRLCGYPSDFNYRARLAAFFGIPDYRGKDFQNLQLLDYLYDYYAYLMEDTDSNITDNTENTDEEEKKNQEENDDEKKDQEDNDDEKKDQEDNDDDDEKKEEDDEKHIHEFGPWEALDDTYEIRTCPDDGYQEKREHQGYGPWIDLGNGYEYRICSDCGHVETRKKEVENECDHELGDWEAIDDVYEVRRCKCGQEEEKQEHTYGEWFDNGDGTCSRVCPNCNHVETKEHHVDVWLYENDEYEIGYCSESGCLVRRKHNLGEPTITYVDNGDGTHTKISTYHCPDCNHDIIKEEVMEHGPGTWEAIDDEKERLVDECGHVILEGDHPYEVVVNEDGSIDYTCPNCHHTYHKDAPTHTHGIVEVDRRYLNDGSDICYIPIYGCEDGDMDTYEGDPVLHDSHEVRNGLYVHDECSTCGQRLSEDRLVMPTVSSAISGYDLEVSESDDYDYEIEEDDDFDLQDEDIPQTAYLNLSREDIEYMAAKAMVRLDLENALNDEYEQAKALSLTYKG